MTAHVVLLSTSTYEQTGQDSHCDSLCNALKLTRNRSGPTETLHYLRDLVSSHHVLLEQTQISRRYKLPSDGSHVSLKMTKGPRRRPSLSSALTPGESAISLLGPCVLQGLSLWTVSPLEYSRVRIALAPNLCHYACDGQSLRIDRVLTGTSDLATQRYEDP